MSDIDHPADGNGVDLLSKADEFIKRRRAQLGGAASGGPLQEAPADDIPVLTEVVTGFTPPAAAVEAAVSRDRGAEVAREIDAWLDENLPQVVVHVMDGITDKLIQQVHESVREDLLPRLKHASRDDAEAGED